MMREQTFTLPDLGEGLTEAEVVEWLVQDGDQVSVDQHIVVVETAKATVEVPCPYAGQVAQRHGAEGEVVPVGAPLLTVASDRRAENGADSETAAAEAAARHDDAAAGSGAVLIGYGTSPEADASTGRGSGGRAGRRAALRASRTRVETADPEVPTASPALASAPKVLSPIVRRLAADRGIDLSSVHPGPGGVIRRRDLDAASSHVPQPTEQAGDRVPMTGIRRAVADKLGRAHREIPAATTWVDADATGLLAAKDALGLPRGGLLALLGRICVAGLHRFPELNASIADADAHGIGDIVRHPEVGLGFAADSPRGLVVPVIHDAGRLTTRQLACAFGELVDAARSGSIQPSQLRGGTFTLNNYGVFGVDGSTPILNHPEAAMLGVGRIIDRPWVLEGRLEVRKVVQLGLTFDHRVCDGGVAGGFLRFVADAVERPLALLADL